MIPSIFVGPWYNDELPESFDFLENREDLLISIPRLRQQRVKKGMFFWYLYLESH